MALYICIECHSFATQQLKNVHNYFPYIHLFMVLNRLLPRARFPAQCRRTLNPVTHFTLIFDLKYRSVRTVCESLFPDKAVGCWEPDIRIEAENILAGTSDFAKTPFQSRQFLLFLIPISC